MRNAAPDDTSNSAHDEALADSLAQIHFFLDKLSGPQAGMTLGAAAIVFIPPVWNRLWAFSPDLALSLAMVVLAPVLWTTYAILGSAVRATKHGIPLEDIQRAADKYGQLIAEGKEPELPREAAEVLERRRRKWLRIGHLGAAVWFIANVLERMIASDDPARRALTVLTFVALGLGAFAYLGAYGLKAYRNSRV